MGYERDEKLMIAILAEVAAKSNGETPIILDLSDPKKEFNYGQLKREKGGVFHFINPSGPISFSKVQAGEQLPRPEKVLIGLSDYGHRYLGELRRLHERDDREKETLEIARQSSRTANWSFWIAVIALLASLPAVAVALNYFFGWI